MGPFHIGDKRTFSRVIEGSPAKVHLLIKYPDDTQDAYATSASGSTYSCTAVPAFSQAKTHTLRWNIYESAEDTTPVESEEEEFEVFPTPFATPFEEP